MSSDSEQNVIENILIELRIGKYQFIIFLILCLFVFFIETGRTTFIFTTRDSTYRCYIPECESPNAEYDKPWLSRALPFEDGEPKKCERFASIKTTHSIGEYKDGECNVEFNNNITELCTKWIFKQGDSIVEELEIPCEDWKRSLVGSLNSGGPLVSLLFIGFLSDKYGRRNIIMILTVLGSVAGLIQSFSQTYWMFAILEFFNISFSFGAYATIYVLAVEFLPTEKRVYGCAIIEFVGSLSIALVGPLAWAVNSWRNLIRVISIPSFIMLLSFFFLPESMRWLYSKGRKRECLTIIQNAAKMNGVTFSNSSTKELTYISKNVFETHLNIKKEVNSQTQITAILTPRPLMIRLFMCAFCWFASVLSYNGTLINAVNIVGTSFNEYLNFFLINFVELPSLLAYLLALRFLGRKPVLFYSLLLSGIVWIIYGTVPISNSSIRLFLYTMGKFFITLSFMLIYIFTTEMFPTYLRNFCLSFCSIVGSIGGILAPQLLLLESIQEFLPMVVFGVFLLVATIATLKLPETRNKNLPDTIAEAVNMT